MFSMCIDKSHVYWTKSYSNTAKQQSIDFNTQDTLRWKQALRAAYAEVFEVLVYFKVDSAV